MSLDKWHWDHVRAALETLRPKWGSQRTGFIEASFVAIGAAITAFVAGCALAGREAEPLEVVGTWGLFFVSVAVAFVCWRAHYSKIEDRQNEVGDVCDYMDKVEALYPKRESKS